MKSENSTNHATPRRRVAVLGSTGSIGTNTLDVIRQHPDAFEVVALGCGSSVDTALKQIEEFRPSWVSVGSSAVAQALAMKLTNHRPAIFFGSEGHRDLVRESSPDVVMSAMMGTHGLLATLQAIKQNVQIVGLANKEIIVMAGPFVSEALKTSTTKLIPVDSEHSAIFQSLMGNNPAAVEKIWLTASGGPFRTRDLSTFESITRAEALRHPNWVMGSKITVDSATMMNKGLEYIEAIRLFHVTPDKINVIVHPESIIHSMVQYCDGSFMAQLGISDMRIPISLALNYPERLTLNLGKSLDLVTLKALNFEAPDLRRFPCLRLAMECELMGPQGSIILNAANEIAVDRFLKDNLRFVHISYLVEEALAAFTDERVKSLDDVVALDDEVKHWASSWQVTHISRPAKLSRETISL